MDQCITSDFKGAFPVGLWIATPALIFPTGDRSLGEGLNSPLLATTGPLTKKTKNLQLPLISFPKKKEKNFLLY